MKYEIGQTITIQNAEYVVVAISKNDENSNRCRLGNWGELLVKRTRNAHRIMKIGILTTGDLFRDFKGSYPLSDEQQAVEYFGNVEVAEFGEDSVISDEEIVAALASKNATKKAKAIIAKMFNVADMDAETRLAIVKSKQ